METFLELIQILISNAILEEAISACSDGFAFLSRQAWLIPVFIILLAVAMVALANQDSLRKKLYIDGKTYYDIILDIFLFSRHKPRNNFTINSLEWDFVCDYHPATRDFLDIEENWTINFSPGRFQTVSDLKLGIQCGNFNDLQQNTIKASQNGVALNRPEIIGINGGDCESICFSLDSDVEHNESGQVEISFNWKKFIIVDRKDDYFYFLPRSLANEVKLFRLKVKHPYDCEPLVYLLKRNWFGNYKKIRITQENVAKYKSTFVEQDPRSFEFTVQDLKAKNVILIIFNKSAS